jgi:hypothetical protein
MAGAGLVGGCVEAWLTGVESAWKVPPYNVVLSRRHEPVEHNSTCARRLRR